MDVQTKVEFLFPVNHADQGLSHALFYPRPLPRPGHEGMALLLPHSVNHHVRESDVLKLHGPRGNVNEMLPKEDLKEAIVHAPQSW